MFVSVLGKEKNDGARSEMLQSFNIFTGFHWSQCFVTRKWFILKFWNITQHNRQLNMSSFNCVPGSTNLKKRKIKKKKKIFCMCMCKYWTFVYWVFNILVFEYFFFFFLQSYNCCDLDSGWIFCIRRVPSPTLFSVSLRFHRSPAMQVV